MSQPISEHLDQLLGSSTTRVTLTAPETQTISPDDNIQLLDLGYRIASAVGNGVVGQLLGTNGNSGRLSGTKNSSTKNQVARDLLGKKNEYPAGRSLTAIQVELKTSAESLQQFANNWTSGQLLTGLLSLVGGLLNTLGAVLGDVVTGLCGLAGADRKSVV